MPCHPITRDLVVRALEQHGPLTSAQISEKTGMPKFSVNAGLRHARGAVPKLVRISAYHRNIVVRGRLAPVYDLGSKKDAAPPKIDPQDNKRRYREKNSAKIRLSDQLRRTGTVNPYLQLIALCP